MNDTLPVNPASTKPLSAWRWLPSVLIVTLAFAIGLGTGYITWGRQVSELEDTLAQAEAAAQQQAAAQDQPQQVKRYAVPVDDDPAIGPENAPITIIEFSDYECPYCQKWHSEVFANIRRDYQDQVRFVYRDFPLQNHTNAAPAAEAANCAHEQGAFWEFHDRLFSGAYGLSSSAYIRYASDLGLDVQAFESCVSSRKYQAEVQADFEYAANLGINSTPTFFLNGIPLVGAQPYEFFKQVIDKELAGEIP